MRSAWVLLLLLVPLASTPAADWPQWMGPNRDGTWTETGILKKFPTGGPKKLWSVPIHGGYSGPAVATGRVFVHDYERLAGDATNNPALQNALQGFECVHCYDEKTGEKLWQHRYDCPYKISYPSGPRCTPTVADGKVYTLGAMGNLHCYDCATGKLEWAKDFKQSHKARTPTWGFAGHPLIHKDRLICLVGGEQKSLLVAFDRKTGDELWRTLDTSVVDGPGYCAPTIVPAGGKEQLIFWGPRALYSLDPDTGKKYWSIPLAPKYGMSIMSPRFHDNRLFAGGIGGVSVCVKLDPHQPTAQVEWEGNADTGLCPVNVTPIIDNGVIYGFCQPGILRAVNLATGQRLWSTFQPLTGEEKDEDYRGVGSGTAFLVKNADHYYLFAETGELIIAQLTPEKYTEIDRARLLSPTGEAFGRRVVWSHPAFADRCIFVRNDAELACYSLAATP